MLDRQSLDNAIFNATAHFSAIFDDDFAIPLAREQNSLSLANDEWWTQHAPDERKPGDEADE